jgi:hypothetical protein
MSTIPTDGQALRRSGRSWAWGIAGTYLFFALATLGFVGFSLTQSTGLVSADYYSQAIQHQSRLDATLRAQALPDSLSWQIAVNDDRLLCRFPRTGISGTLHLYRPADERLDRRFDIALSNGSQEIAGLQQGHWQLKVQWHMDGKDYYYQQDLRIGN